MSGVKLLPCPFCGGTDLRTRGGSVTFWVQCADFLCGADGPVSTTKRGAADAWNKRTPAPPEGT